jgi:hypothetical protein
MWLPVSYQSIEITAHFICDHPVLLCRLCLGKYLRTLREFCYKNKMWHTGITQVLMQSGREILSLFEKSGHSEHCPLVCSETLVCTANLEAKKLLVYQVEITLKMVNYSDNRFETQIEEAKV